MRDQQKLDGLGGGEEKMYTTVDTTQITNSIRKLYQEERCGPLEFLYRGRIRSLKDENIRKLECIYNDCIKEFNAQIEKISKHRISEKRNEDVKQISIPASFRSRLLNWLSGSERDAKLKQMLKKMDSEIRTMEEMDVKLNRDIANLNKIHDKNIEAISRLYAAISDAYEHNVLIKCGWTWWR